MNLPMRGFRRLWAMSPSISTTSGDVRRQGTRGRVRQQRVHGEHRGPGFGERRCVGSCHGAFLLASSISFSDTPRAAISSRAWSKPRAGSLRCNSSRAWTGNPLDIDGPPLTDIFAVLGSVFAVLFQSFDFFLAALLIGGVFFSVALSGLLIWEDRGR